MKKLGRSPSIFYLSAIILMFGIMFLPTLIFASSFSHHSPAFTVTYPDGWNTGTCIYPYQILNAVDPSGNTLLHVNVVDLPEDAKLDDAGKRLVSVLKNIGTDVTAISDKEIQLKDGTPARECVVKWKWGGIVPFNTISVMAIKGKKQIGVGVHTPREIGEVEKEIGHSLTLVGQKTYSNKEPNFCVSYPENCQPRPFMSEREVLRVQGQFGSIVATISDIPDNAELMESGTNFVNVLKTVPVALDVKLCSSEQTELVDGTPAAMNAIEWKLNVVPIKTLALTVFKDKKAITVWVDSWLMGMKDWGSDVEAEAKEILYSLSFK
jgi:hypothetical protein